MAYLMLKFFCLSAKQTPVEHTENVKIVFL